ncbi:MAG: hypothetical protein KKC76_15700 [Proteobacteria bacterium]|nr:hypothetical protein [Pseudomonadota bacterium]MBU4294553.1 hypothetical protein [Pseudomonadota bacterium]MCG2747089.1 hypothetical protein [Desulfobulbaceae bacterium]
MSPAVSSFIPCLAFVKNFPAGHEQYRHNNHWRNQCCSLKVQNSGQNDSEIRKAYPENVKHAGKVYTVYADMTFFNEPARYATK